MPFLYHIWSASLEKSISTWTIYTLTFKAIDLKTPKRVLPVPLPVPKRVLPVPLPVPKRVLPVHQVTPLFHGMDLLVHGTDLLVHGRDLTFSSSKVGWKQDFYTLFQVIADFLHTVLRGLISSHLHFNWQSIRLTIFTNNKIISANHWKAFTLPSARN